MAKLKLTDTGISIECEDEDKLLLQETGSGIIELMKAKKLNVGQASLLIKSLDKTLMDAMEKEFSEKIINDKLN